MRSEYRRTPSVVGRVVGGAYGWNLFVWKVDGQRSGELAAPVHLKIGGLFPAFFGELLGSSSERFGSSWAHLGSLLGALGVVSGVFWELWGRLGSSWELLARLGSSALLHNSIAKMLYCLRFSKRALLK